MNEEAPKITAERLRVATALAELNLEMLRPLFDARGIFIPEDIEDALRAQAEKALRDMSPPLFVALIILEPAELRAWHAHHIAPAFHARILQELDS